MGKINNNLIKALKITFRDEIAKKSGIEKYFKTLPYLLERYTEKELTSPIFFNFISKIPEILREYECIEFLENNKDTIKKYPDGEKTARRCLEEIFRARYKPGYKKGKDFLDTGQ